MILGKALSDNRVEEFIDASAQKREASIVYKIQENGKIQIIKPFLPKGGGEKNVRKN